MPHGMMHVKGMAQVAMPVVCLLLAQLVLVKLGARGHLVHDLRDHGLVHALHPCFCVRKRAPAHQSTLHRNRGARRALGA